MQQAEPKSEVNEKFQNLPILVIDDEEYALKSIEAQLERRGYKVFTAKDGNEAISLLETEDIALILCDQMMPGMTGIEVLQKALQIRPDAERILLTGYSSHDIAIDAINVGHVSQYLTKPCDPHILQRTVEVSLERYRLIEENRKLQEKIAENHRLLLKDLCLGAKIQEELLIGKIPQKTPSLDIGAISIPSRHIDGDFFEFYQPNSAILDLVIGDVMGKGIPAALVGTAVKAEFARFAIPHRRAQILDRRSMWEEDLLRPEEVLERVHEEIGPSLENLHYLVSLFYGRFHFVKKIFSYIDCGFPKPFHYSANTGKIHVLQGENLPLGVMLGEELVLFETSFSRGDLFLFYSDGVIEAQNSEGELFGVERLRAFLEKRCDLPSRELIREIQSEVFSFTEKQECDDDLTLVAIKVVGTEKLQGVLHKAAKFSANISQIDAVRAYVERYCARAPGDCANLSNQLQLAVNEAFCNIAKHGYAEKERGAILIEATLLEEGILFELSDQGAPFSSEEICEPSLYGDRESGFGWHIIRELSEQVSYEPKHTDNGWNHLKIYKKYEFAGGHMEVDQSMEGEILLLKPKIESLDARNADEFKSEISEMIGKSESKRVILDLGNLQFIDSSGLGGLLSALKLASSQNVELRLSSLTKKVRTIFEIVSMHKIFEIYNTKEEATRSFE